MATQTVPQSTDTALDPTRRPDRRAMLDLIHEAIMADGLPVPNCIAFYEKHPDPKAHSIGMHVDSLDDCAVWRGYLGGSLRGLLVDWCNWPVMVHPPAPPRVVDPVDAQADALLADLADIPVAVGTPAEVAAKIGGA